MRAQTHTHTGTYTHGMEGKGSYVKNLETNFIVLGLYK